MIGDDMNNIETGGLAARPAKWAGVFVMAVVMAGCQPSAAGPSDCEGASCPDGGSEQTPCEQHTDCEIGEQCIAGVCQQAPPCTTKADCPLDHVCKRGGCYEPDDDGSGEDAGAHDTGAETGDTGAETGCPIPADAVPADMEGCPDPDNDVSEGDVADRDGDGVLDARDNCPNVENPDQENCGDDDRGNACDPDDDGDGTADGDDCAPCDGSVHPKVGRDCCNGEDDDCDAEVDEDAACRNYCSCKDGVCRDDGALCGNSC